MKRIFNKSSQSQPVTTASYQDEQNITRLPPSLQPGSGSHTFSYQQDEQWTSSQPTSPPAPLKRSGDRATGTHNQNIPSERLSRSSRQPKSASGTAYPSYGEVQIDSNENRGGGHVDHSSNEPMEAVVHDKLPARSAVSKLAHSKHSRSRSAALQQGQDFYQDQYPVRSQGEVDARYVNRRDGVERHSSMSRGQSAASRNPIKGITRRSSQVQRRVYNEEQDERPIRKNSLLYGIDSGVHGGYASAAMATASEQDSQDALHSTKDRDPNLLHSEARYIDRYTDMRTPQSIAIANGMEKVRKRLFGRRKKDDGGYIDEKDKESSGEWARVEQSASMDRHDFFPAEAERSTERLNGHAPWFGGKKQVGDKVKEESIIPQINSFCIHIEEDWDWNQLQVLCNAISHSEAASKEAAKALRKELKSGEEWERFRAVRLWAIICLRAGDRFRLQVANKKFLEVLEDLYFDEETSTKLRGRLLLLWSMLAFEFHQDQDLYPITKMFNKVKPNEMPANGFELDPAHELFNPLPVSNEQRQQQRKQTNQKKYDSVPIQFSQDINKDQQIAPERARYDPTPHEHRFVPPPLPAASLKPAEAPRTQSYHTNSGVATHDKDLQDDLLSQDMLRYSEDIRRLHEECIIARSNAQLMTDALIEHGLDSELVTEFAAKTQQSQDTIMAQIPWASALADQSKAERQNRMMARRSSAEYSEGQDSKEEVLLEDLLDTHMKLSAANSMITEAKDRQREEEEERQAIDQSMREQRMDRSTLVEEQSTGHFYSIQSRGLAPPMEASSSSSSRSHSPIPTVVRKPLPVPGSAEMQKSLSNSNSSPMGTLSPANNNQSITPNTTSIHRSSTRPRNDPTYDISSEHEDADNSGSIIMTPTAPSAKALGKRRAMSTRDSPSSINDNNTNDNNDNNHHQNNSTITHLAGQVTNAMKLESTPDEETLRARPPPALPNHPNHVSLISSNHIYYQ